MFNLSRISLALTFVFSLSLIAQEAHDHKAPEKLGEVSFPISCDPSDPSVQQEFNRSVALLHSFAYTAAEKSFQQVAERDPHCAMAHWGIAMTHYHQLWEPALSPAAISLVEQEIHLAQQIGANSQRERAFINALALIFQDASTVPYRTRALNYEHAMSDLAAENSNDVEAQVFYALALLANASPSDKTHQNQKHAADILEPLYRLYPLHPGIPHYIIHACDNGELATRGLPAARAYANIAPSAPHALHMPSHIFTRLGLWDDSIASNTAARDAAHQQGDTGEELHAMDYLEYAYLQSGRDQQAAQVVQQSKEMQNAGDLKTTDFKTGYAATAIPIRYAVERHQWSEAINIVPPAAAPPHVIAIAVWAKGLALARTGHPAEARKETDKLLLIQQQLRASGNDYWATQVSIMMREVLAWSSQADNKPAEAAALMRKTADEEDAVEKLPVTPGPIVPAREQLGELLLQQNHPDLASKEFETALVNAPGRRGALQGAALAAHAPHPAASSSNSSGPPRRKRELQHADVVFLAEGNCLLGNLLRRL
jgi:tetratricopeptide (TPR) repeat protein